MFFGCLQSLKSLNTTEGNYYAVTFYKVYCMNLKILCVALLAFFSLIPLGFPAVLLLNYNECVNDTLSNNTYCSKPDKSLNETPIYLQCIADAKAYGFELNNTLYARFAQNDDSVKNTITNFSIVTKETINNLSSSISVFAEAINRVQGINLTGNYVTCLLDLNTTKISEKRQTEEAQQREKELTAYKIQTLETTVKKEEYDKKVQETSALQSDLKKAQEEKNTFAGIGFAVGVGVIYWFRRGTPRDQLDTREGRATRPGNV